MRRSWEMIEAAANNLWGAQCNLSHTFTVPLQNNVHSKNQKDVYTVAVVFVFLTASSPLE